MHRTVASTDPVTGSTVIVAQSYWLSKLHDAVVPVSAAASRVLHAGEIIAAAGLAPAPASAAAATTHPPIRLIARDPRINLFPLRRFVFVRTAASRAT